MEKEQLAELYSSERKEEIKKFLKDAFLEGYQKRMLKASNVVNIDGVEYVDMGLPSGTLWSSCPLWHCAYGYKLQLLSYSEALKLNIPSLEQWLELKETCLVKEGKMISPNGKRIGYRYAPNGNYVMYDLGEECQKGRNMFWVKSDVAQSNQASTMIFDTYVCGTGKHFTGFRLPVFLVRERDEVTG